MSQTHDDPALDLEALDLDDRGAADISALLDGELPPDRLFEAIDALVDSPECRTFYRRARALDGLIAAAEPSPAEEPPRDVWSRIADAAGLPGGDASGWGARRARWVGPLVGTLAATVLVAIVAFGVRSAQRERGESPQPNAIAATDLDAITIGGNRGEMTDERFLALAEELLGADRHYRREMAEIILTVESALPSEMGTLEPQRTGDGRESSLARSELDSAEGGPATANRGVRIW
ncbi:MAG TPA: hypothetical protein VMV46_01890 [Thermoanaerobaculia bacterium]|nr:hypothetical protein [Thermoanaerobaculia bacterium]